MFVFDDECAYIGSANITAAAIGKRASGSRNHEAGMLVWGPTMIQAPLHHFERAWNDPDILKSTSLLSTNDDLILYLCSQNG